MMTLPGRQHGRSAISAAFDAAGGEARCALIPYLTLGYPSPAESLTLVPALQAGGADIIELGVPFSDPVADGPTIQRASQAALRAGVTPRDCLDLAGAVAQAFDIPFLLMSYYNIPFSYGLPEFAAAMAERRLFGAIVPDLPPEEADPYGAAMARQGLAPIFLFSPSTPTDRMKIVASVARGFIYCVARKGVTGEITRFSRDIEEYLARCRSVSQLPLAVGFGVKERNDVRFLIGKADIAVVGSEAIRVFGSGGLSAVGGFVRRLRE